MKIAENYTVVYFCSLLNGCSGRKYKTPCTPFNSLAPRCHKWQPFALARVLICSQEEACKRSCNLGPHHALVYSEGTQASELPRLLNKSGKQTDYTP